MKLVSENSRGSKLLSVVLIYTLFINQLIPLSMAMERSNNAVDLKFGSSYRTNIKALDATISNPASDGVEKFEKTALVNQSVAATSNGPGLGDMAGSTANVSGNLVDKFSGDLSYSIPLMDVEGFPITLSYNPNVRMEQEASWVGLGWNLALGSINREMRGIPDDFKGDKIERTVKMLDNTVDGKGWSMNIFGGLGNPIYINKSGVQTSAGGLVDLKNGIFPISVSAGIGFSRGKYFNNYTGEGRTRSFNLQGSLGLGANLSYGPATIGASGGISGGIGFSSDTQNGKGVTKSGGFNSSASFGAYGVGLSSGYSAHKSSTSNSRSGVLTKTQGSGSTKGFNLIVAGGVGSKSKGSMRTFGRQTYVPRFSSSNISKSNFTSKGFNLTGQYMAFHAGAGGGSNKHSSHTTVVSLINSYPAYGYQHHSKGQKNETAMLDFNRDRNKAVNTETRVLSFSAQTYDLYYCSAPGFSSSFRSHRYDVVEYHDPTITSTGSSTSKKDDGDPEGITEMNVTGGKGLIGIATGGVSRTKQSANGATINSTSSGISSNEFDGINESQSFNRKEYYLRTIGEVKAVDLNQFDAYGGAKASLLKMNNLLGVSGNLDSDNGSTLPQSTALPTQNYSLAQDQSIVHYREIPFSDLPTVLNITGEVTCVNDVPSVGTTTPKFITPEKAAHHTGAIEVVSEAGMRYVYGIPTYNYEQNEVSFSATGRINETNFANTSLLAYSTGDNSVGNILGRHQSFERTVTPAYATSFLLTEMLSSDYIDRTDDGPTADDQGMYYKLNYTNPYNGVTAENTQPDIWKWRMPMCSDVINSSKGFQYNKNLAYASKNAHSDKWDDMGSYIYGEKEVWYSSTIESKNLIAFFCLKDRHDQFSMQGENGGLDETKPGMALDKIMLFSKNDLEQNPTTAKALQIVEFDYDYSLCPDYVGNKNTYDSGVSDPDFTGKLTLKRVFIYNGESTENKTLPLIFEYGTNNPSFAYNSQDRWGNYKPNDLTNPNHEFPYAEQNENEATNNIQAWKLQSIRTAGGSETEFNYAPDNYGFVQDKRAMRMFNVAGMSNTSELRLIGGGDVDGNGDPIPGTVINDQTLTTINPYTNCFANPDEKEDPYNVIYFKLETPVDEAGAIDKIKKDYLTNSKGQIVDKLYFNMYSKLDNRNEDDPETTVNDETVGYEYVEAEVFLGKHYQYELFAGGAGIPNANGQFEYGWVIVELEDIKKKGNNDDYKSGATDDVMDQLDAKEAKDEPSDIRVNPLQIANWQYAQLNVPCAIYGDINYSANIATDYCDYHLKNDGNIYGRNLYRRLNKKRYGLKFDPSLSQVRLYEPDNTKIGGGSRIESVTNSDNWDQYSDEYNTSYTNTFDYGQDENTSNGVASYEPEVGNNENPFYTFIAYDIARNRLPDERVYQKDPWGDLVFPGATVGYEKVTSQLFDETVLGKTVDFFLTLKDSPTISKRTEVDRIKFAGNSALESPSGDIKEMYGFSQGFYVETSDIHGKPKRNEVYNSQGQLISSDEIDYYETNTDLINYIDETGAIISSRTPRDIDIHVDSWKSFTQSITAREGQTWSVGATILATLPYVLPMFILKNSEDIFFYQNEARAITFNKVVNTYLVPKSVHTTYLGSNNFSKNIYYDKATGTPIVSSMRDEFNDELFSVSYPSNWYYDNLKPMYKTDGAILNASEFMGTGNTVQITNSIHSILFNEGDKLLIGNGTNDLDAWVLEEQSGVYYLIDMDGALLTGINWSDPEIRILINRTGVKNDMSSQMMSVVTKKLPPQVGSSFVFPTNDIINSNVVRLNENKNVSCIPLSVVGTPEANNYSEIQLEPGEIINPYLIGTKGNLRNTSSFVFQNERDESDQNTIRQNAVLSNYEPFYDIVNGEWFAIDESGHPDNTSVGEFNDWRKIEEINVFDEFGKPLQATNQIGVSSSVQYGLNKDLKLTTEAVASNAKSNEIGFDGFEDYNYYTSSNLGYLDYGFSLKPVNATNIVSDQKHSGRYSLKVNTQLDYEFSVATPTLVESNSLGGEYAVRECNCIQSFAPEIGKEYHFSTWVHEETRVYPFLNSKVKIEYLDGNGIVLGSTIEFLPQGAVIDGWQKIEGEYTIVNGATNIRISLIATGTSYFDDFRTHPFLAGMITTVFDQETLLPMATHDAYNYTTFFGYDENFRQVRMRVETIEGIQTISESENGSNRNQ
jgi:hypothetical protein